LPVGYFISSEKRTVGMTALNTRNLSSERTAIAFVYGTVNVCLLKGDFITYEEN